MTDNNLGAYTRHESPDYADGGIAAAQIEKEAERPTAADFAKAEFARHPDGRVAARMVPKDDAGHQWLVADADATDLTGPDVAGYLDQYMDSGMARSDWSPVRECPHPEQHDDRYVSPLAVERVQEVQARLEKAEQDRDEARNIKVTANVVSMGDSEPRPLDWREHPRYDQDTARDFLDAAWEVAYVPEGEQLPDRAIYIARHASGNYRIERAYLPTSTSDEDTERRLLDPPVPTRPEGAEDIEALLDELFRDGPMTNQDLADSLAANGIGVRVEGNGR